MFGKMKIANKYLHPPSQKKKTPLMGFLDHMSKNLYGAIWTNHLAGIQLA